MHPEIYCMYLRKSRADAEAEARGEGETLARHQKALRELAEKRNLQIAKEYREIVSGESISARPQMQAMLADIRAGTYTGVLCMEIERLARGNTIDQGIVAQAFKESGTLIVTPMKTYHPDNEFDEEYFEFSLFMSRREYKTIRRRMQAGRLSAVKEGCFIAPDAPYGYRKIQPEPKIHTLEIVPEEAEAVRLIYDLYLSGTGARRIADELNRRGIPARKNPLWEVPSIRKILKNPVYAGFLQWHTKENGDVCYQGLHPAIIGQEQFQKVQERRKRHPSAQVQSGKTLCNYYHNLLYCGSCGHQMGRRYLRNSGNEHLLCRYRQCRGKSVSSSVKAVDAVVMTALRLRLAEMKEITEYQKPPEKHQAERCQKMLERELEKIIRQQKKLYDFLEQEIYTADMFQGRMQILHQKKQALEEELSACRKEEARPERIPEECIIRLQEVLERFPQAGAEEKNALLCSVIRRIDYEKIRKSDADLNLKIQFM